MSKAGKICSLKLQGNNGHELVGTAAQLHYISRRGGWDQFIRDLCLEIGQSVAAQVSDALIAEALSPQSPRETPALKECLRASGVRAVAVAESTRHVH